MKRLIPGKNDLRTLFPQIAKEAYGWDPRTVIAGSNANHKWACRKCSGSWWAPVSRRTSHKTGCPYCTGRTVLPGLNDLATKYPEISKELVDRSLAKTVTPRSHKRLIWKCTHCRGIWCTSVSNRTTHKSGCPYCANRKVLPGGNDLRTTHPEIANQAYGWDPTTVVAGSHKRQQWQCAKERSHIWLASVIDRVNKRGCPYCANKRIALGENDLRSTHSHIAKEAFGWDPQTVVAGSTQRLPWKCQKNNRHIWIMMVNQRTGPHKQGCPYCAGKKVAPGDNDLATTHPQIAKEAYKWDPRTVTSGSGKKQQWQCTKNKRHIWKTTVCGRTGPQKLGCPYCANKVVLPGVNDLRTTHPQIAKEAYGWDPSTVVAGSKKRLQWRCKNNKAHIWSTAVGERSRVRKRGCPYCAGRKVLQGDNDLATTHPQIAKEAYKWDPCSVIAGNNQKRDWQCAKNKRHTWSATPNDRTQGYGCPYCVGLKVLRGDNDLATVHPDIAKELVDQSLAHKVTGTSSRKLEWHCKKGHIWSARVANRTSNKSGCPECAEFGFSPLKDAWLYLMGRPGEQQFGITNVPESRLQTHASNGWISLDWHGPASGKLVYSIERNLKQWIKKTHGVIPGTMENWSTAKFRVKNLGELCSQAGVDLHDIPRDLSLVKKHRKRVTRKE